MRLLFRLFAIFSSSKRCYVCKWYLPLFAFDKTENKHLLRNPTTRGRRYTCKQCSKELGITNIMVKKKRKKIKPRISTKP